jgi:FkbM family methyltransferase
MRTPFEILKRAGVPIPHQIYQHLIYRGPFTVRGPMGCEFRLMSNGHEVENNLYWEGVKGFDPECVVPWVAFANASRTVLDIGANTGFYGFLAASTPTGPEVHAFEPVGRIAALLRSNCELNPGLRIKVHQCAVGAHDGSADLFDPGGDNCYSASLSSTFLASKTETYRVDVVAIDTLVKRHELDNIDLVKLDVEGCEEMALDGMAETVRVFRPTILLEVLSPPRPSLVERITRLLGDDYQLFQLHLNGLRASDGVAPLPGTFNVLLNPRERALPSME